MVNTLLLCNKDRIFFYLGRGYVFIYIFIFTRRRFTIKCSLVFCYIINVREVTGEGCPSGMSLITLIFFRGSRILFIALRSCLNALYRRYRRLKMFTFSLNGISIIVLLLNLLSLCLKRR